MSKLYQSGDRFFFWCPGCKEPHFFQTAGTPAWQFNADLENPTFTPSLMTTTRRGDRDHTCHLFVTQGNIQFLGDCSHEYRSQTIPLPDWEREENAMHRTIKKAKEDEGTQLQASGPPPATPAPAPEPLPYFLSVAEHVVPGLEDREIVIAKDQPEYKPLAALPAGDERGTVLSRWTFDTEARAAVARGADLYLEVLTFGHPFQPTVMFVHEKLDKQMVLDSYFAPLPAPTPASDLTKKAIAASASGVDPAPPSDEKQTAEEPHEAHHIKCRTCGVWYNKNDASCPNCSTRTPIVVGG